MKRVNRILWGVILVAVGVLFALNALNITDIDIFFKGWWTLFIIVPCLIGLITDRDKWGALIGLCVGVILLLSCQGIMMWELLVPAIIVLIGLRLIFRDTFNKKAREVAEKFKNTAAPAQQVCATFSGQKVNYAGQVLENMELTAVFGGVECDLRGAIIDKDVLIKATAVFGGVDIWAPDNVNVMVRSNSLFGGVDNKRPAGFINGAPTVYVEANCLFGGADIQ